MSRDSAPVRNRLSARHIFGVLIPSFNSIVEPELASLRVPGVTHQTTRFDVGPDVVEEICDRAERLAQSGVESWIFGLSTEPFPGGLELLDRGLEELGKRTGLPVHAAPYACRAALRALDARRLGIVTPFDDATNEQVRHVYESWGFEVVAMAGLSRGGFDQIANVSDSITVDAFRGVARDDVDTLLQVGGGLPMLHQLDDLENRFARPVVAPNVAVYWQGLRAAGIHDRIERAGRLFAMPSQNPSSGNVSNGTTEVDPR